MFLHPGAALAGIARHGMNRRRVILWQQPGFKQGAQQPDRTGGIATGVADALRRGDAVCLLPAQVLALNRKQDQ